MRTDNSKIEQILRDFESCLGVTVTVHDRTGIFHNNEGMELLGLRRGSHRRLPVCEKGFCQKCRDHCLTGVQRKMTASLQPFTHTCWKGLKEVVVPVSRNGEHLATLFTGIWKTDEPERYFLVHEKLPRAFHRSYEDLEHLPETSARTLERVCMTMGKGILATLESLLALDDESGTTRRGQIRSFMKFRASRKVTLADLARFLHLSPSRAGHVVQELFCKPFQALLREERLARVRTMLLTTDLPLAEIAHNIGIENEYYLNRMFREAEGVPPGKFRRTRR